MNPDPKSGSAFSFQVGSGSGCGSAKNGCGSETLITTTRDTKNLGWFNVWLDFLATVNQIRIRIQIRNKSSKWTLRSIKYLNNSVHIFSSHILHLFPLWPQFYFSDPQPGKTGTLKDQQSERVSLRKPLWRSGRLQGERILYVVQIPRRVKIWSRKM